MMPYTPDQVKLGFIGMGAMGSRIARRLQDHGEELISNLLLYAGRALAQSAPGCPNHPWFSRGAKSSSRCEQFS
jgi:hypothetical protein